MNKKSTVKRKTGKGKGKGATMKIARVLKPRVGRKSNVKKVAFQVQASGAQSVALTGDFNSWGDQGLKMKKGRDGIWKIGMNLAPGRYEYKFIVDGQWWTDPVNPHAVTNSFGAVNSVIEVGA